MGVRWGHPFFVDMRELELRSAGIDAQHPEDRFFFVAAVAAGVDADGG